MVEIAWQCYHCLWSLKGGILIAAFPTNLGRALVSLPGGRRLKADKFKNLFQGYEISVWPCTTQELSQLSSFPRGVIPKHPLKQPHYSCSEGTSQPHHAHSSWDSEWHCLKLFLMRNKAPIAFSVALPSAFPQVLLTWSYFPISSHIDCPFTTSFFLFFFFLFFWDWGLPSCKHHLHFFVAVCALCFLIYSHICSTVFSLTNNPLFFTSVRCSHPHLLCHKSCAIS